MNDRTIKISINGRDLEVRYGVTVAAALIENGVEGFRCSVDGEARAPLCGMGICFECRATVGGVSHTRTCMLLAADGMMIETD